jgi:hydrogenase maturation protease
MGRTAVVKRGLVIGIGNVLRGDDGLGPQTVTLLDSIGFDGRDVGTIALPQLDITLATSLASVDYAVFVDARLHDSEDEVKIVHLVQTERSTTLSHTSHSLSIPSLIEMTRELYGKAPDCYMVVPKGHDFSIGEQLSPRAEANRRLAAKNVIDLVRRIS